MEKTYHILGMMSGTSLDGLDLALAALKRSKGSWSFRLLKSSCITYDASWRGRLTASIGMDAPSLLALHADYGDWLGQQATGFLKDVTGPVDAIASHGHTVHHQPDRGFTFQLGCPQRLALTSALPVIGDFRSLDVALGGQGAPLVPIGDRLLFGTYDLCLNLGGISNISLERGGERIAFDIGIANMLLNHLSRQAGLDFDRDGALAKQGVLNEPLLENLNALEYYRKPIPKSTGYEWFRDAVLPVVEAHPDTLENQLHTATRHIAQQAGASIRSLSKPGSRILVTGGGALNTYLMHCLRENCGNALTLEVPDRELIEYKEALVFALLGALRLAGETNVLASVTGASRDSCSGVYYLP